MTEATAVVLAVWPGEDPFERIAEHACTAWRARLPDLRAVTVLLPRLEFAGRLRAVLWQRAARLGHTALLGPRITTLRDWVLERQPPEHPALTGYARELFMVEALRGHARLFNEQSPWRLSEGLLALIDELTLYAGALPEARAEFERLLAECYGVGAQRFAPLTQEARAVHTLWRAYHEQLDACGQTDATRQYVHALAARPMPDPGEHLVVIAPPRPAPPEADWLEALRGHRHAVCVSAAAAETGVPAEPYAALLDSVFDTGAAPLRERAQAFAERHPESPAGALRIYTADDFETEAHAVDVQVRAWLLAGRRAIGIVTEDRRLARRVRALLERAGVELRDSVGWALSTTSAAAAVVRWLETVEEDFAAQPLLDLLKSPFAFADQPRDVHRQHVYRLERDIIRHENITRGLERYRNHVRYRRHRLQRWNPEAVSGVLALLKALQHAAQPLLRLAHGKRARPAAEYLDALEESLRRLGMDAALAADAAGARVQEVFARMRAAAAARGVAIHWHEFRTWLGRSLERHYFEPPVRATAVHLLDLDRSHLARFDALIVAGLDRRHLPGAEPASPYFNDRVRAELGLPTWEQTVQERMRRFRELLHAAPEILLTVRREDDGEPVLPSPWLEALRTFHRLAYGGDLEAGALSAWVRDPRTQVLQTDAAPLPHPLPAPAPVLPAALRPRELSVAAHQRLIHCPYQFFAADGLRLKPLDEIREQLQKSDYGGRVHQCLEAFYRDVEHLPGPFDGPVTPANRAAAIECLRAIARAVFARDLEDNFEHRGWLHRWERTIPAFVDWEIARAQAWRAHAVETEVRAALDENHVLVGRIDRIDRPVTASAGGVALVDYKTGQPPAQRAVDAGEDVQLASYAVLTRAQGDPAARVEYVQLDRGAVQNRAHLDGNALAEMERAVAHRLREVLGAIDRDEALPAWGDAETCRRCDFDGVCRLQERR